MSEKTSVTNSNDPEVKSVGIVSSQIIEFNDTIDLQCGISLSSYELIVETYGELNNRKDNAILICHALSSDHHAAGKYSEEDKKSGWWDSYIGPGKPIDTNKFFVICSNLILCHLNYIFICKKVEYLSLHLKWCGIWYVQISICVNI